jgi:DNA-binding GntR family transcriptional regulator
MALTHLTLQQAIADAIRSRIISGQLPAGVKIDQDAIAEEFSISRMPVREALRQLGAEGFVTLVPHRGAIVTALSPAEVEEIYDIRAALEGLAARHATGALTAEDLEALSLTLAAMRNEGRTDQWLAMNESFHGTIIRASGRPRLVALIKRHREQSEPYIRLYVHHLHKSSQARDEHEAILAALRERDPDRAAAAVRRHLLSTGRTVATQALSAEATIVPPAPADATP